MLRNDCAVAGDRSPGPPLVMLLPNWVDQFMKPEISTLIQERPEVRSSARSVVGRILMHAGFIVIAAGLYVAHGHFSAQTQPMLSLACLVGAAGFALAPLRALLGELLGLESQVLHLVHGVGGLAIVGLSLGGVISSGPLQTHAALAPFAIMGAAQAIMHQDHPRNAQQAEALRRFATSLPEVAQISKGGSLTSPENAARAVSILSDLLAKAQALGETELQADPGFQSALRQVTTRFGLSLGLDSINNAINTLAKNPAAASAVPGLRRQLAKARNASDRKESPASP